MSGCICDEVIALRRELGERSTALLKSQAEARRYRVLLEEVEWVQPPDESMYPRCPWCDAVKLDGHRRTCALNAALHAEEDGK